MPTSKGGGGGVVGEDANLGPPRSLQLGRAPALAAVGSGAQERGLSWTRWPVGVDEMPRWGRQLEGRGGSGPSPQGGEGEAAEGMEEGPRAGEELGQSRPSLRQPCCLHLRGEAPCAVTPAILSLSPFMAPEVSSGGWRTAPALRWKWKHGEQKDSSRRPLPGTGILNTQLRGRPAEPAGREPLILAEGPATLGVPAARSGPAWASREAVAAACSLAGAQRGGEEGAAAQLQPPRQAAESSCASRR